MSTFFGVSTLTQWSVWHRKRHPLWAYPWISSCALLCAFHEHFRERARGSNFALRVLCVCRSSEFPCPKQRKQLQSMFKDACRAHVGATLLRIVDCLENWVHQAITFAIASEFCRKLPSDLRSWFSEIPRFVPICSNLLRFFRFVSRTNQINQGNPFLPTPFASPRF